MAAYTSTQSGNWSAAATWGGGGTPGNGDSATIANGHMATYDVDASGYATGFVGITVASGGILQFDVTKSTHLKMDGVSNHNITVNGELKIGTSETPLSSAFQAIIELGALSRITGTGTGALYGSIPTDQHCRTIAAHTTADSTLQIDTDLTQPGNSSQWATGRALVVANINRGLEVHRLGRYARTIAGIQGEYIDSLGNPRSAFQAVSGASTGEVYRPTVSTGYLYEVLNDGTTDDEPTWPTTPDATVFSGDVEFKCLAIVPTITLSSTLGNNLLSGAVIALAELNVDIRLSGASNGIALYECEDWIVGASIRCVTAYTTGSLTSRCYNSTFNGPLANCAGNGVYIGNGCTINGPLAACGTSINTTVGCTVNGVVIGSDNTCSACTDIIFNGLIAGNTNAANSTASRITVNGGIEGCQNGILSSYTVLKSTLHNCMSGIQGGVQNVVDAAITLCNSGIYRNAQCTRLLAGAQLGGSGALANTVDIDAVGISVCGSGASLLSAAQVSGYSGVPLVSGGLGVCIWDIGGNAGHLRSWTGGGTMATITSGLPASPPVSMSYAHQVTHESDAGPAYVEYPIFLGAGETLRARIYAYIPAGLPSDFSVDPPSVCLCDPRYTVDDEDGILDSDAASDGFDVDGWYKLSIEYTAASDCQLTLRVYAQDSSQAWVWYPVITGGEVPAVTDVRKDVVYSRGLLTGTYEPEPVSGYRPRMRTFGV